MTKTNNKFNSLAQINFVEDIDQETAANYSGGAPSAIIYEDSDFRGNALALESGPTGRNNLPADFNDKTSSIRILEGQWEFYKDGNEKGDVIFLGPGNYSQIAPSGNDSISSWKRVG